MEDDDEFGDLYTDVLRPFSSSLSSTPQSQPPPRIDLNIKKDDDDNEILHGLSQSNPPGPSNQNSIQITANSAPPVRVLGDSSLDANTLIKDSIGEGKGVNFDIEEVHNGILDDSGPIIPGLMGDDSRKIEVAADVDGCRGDWEGGQEEESDSEDDLQIVLNDNSHPSGSMGIDREIGDDDDDDEDEDPLVIVADGDAPNQAIEEQDWGGGEDGVAAAGGGVEAEKKEGGEASGKGNALVGPKIGYSNHGYHHHPFHSQFKYVRPGATPISAATTFGPGATPGQVHPPINMGAIAGRGRGDWRPAGIKGGPQKNFHPGFGGPVWGTGRGFGGGLEFTLPSHKTIFEVDIDGFEEKPWKYPGVDISDYFNFGLNEESWKAYCKQLEQHRLETTMQSKIRVYESGRAEQDYDPDLPPELAAATSLRDVPADNSNPGKSVVGHSDLTKGSAQLRPLLPTGRAIQVETGYGERIPSIEGRAPRLRDSDAIIEIVCQDSLDDSSTGNAVQDEANKSPKKDDFRGSDVAEVDMAQTENDYVDDFPQAYDGQKGGRRTSYMNSVHSNMPEEDGVLPLHPEAPAPYRTGSSGHPPLYPGRDVGTPHKERQTHRGRSPNLTPTRSSRDNRLLDNMEEVSTESMDGKEGLRLASPVTVRDAREVSIEEKDDDEPLRAEGSPSLERDETTENEETANDTPMAGNMQHHTKKQKIGSHVEQPALQQLDEGEDSKAARSSENSKARSGSSKDHQKWQDGVEEEVVQDGRSTRSGSIRKHLDESEQNFRRKDRDVRQETERNRIMIRGREDSYPYRDLDPSLPHHLHLKHEGYDRRKERENPDVPRQQRGEDPHGRKHRTEDRKRERGDEMGSRHRSKIRETERGDKDEYIHSRKQLENGSYRIHHDKDGSSRHREREDSLKSRFEIVDDYHSKRRKDEEYLKREFVDKEEILHGHRETSSRRRRERDDQQRVRDSLDDYHSVRHKDDIWLQRERSERQREREREDIYRLKQPNEENLPKRERDEGRASSRSGRCLDEKAWAGNARAKDEYKGSDKEYQLKDAVRNSDHQKRRDRMEDESLPHHRGRDDVYARGNQFSIEERRSRQERPSTRNDRTVDTSDNQRVHDKKHRGNTRKNKESEGADHATLGPSRRNQEDQSGHSDEMVLKCALEAGNGENEILMQRNSSKRHKEDASSDDEQQDSRRGRSKLERWTSHKERDYSINKSSASLKFKEIEKNNNGGSSEAVKLPDEPSKKVETMEKHPVGEDKDVTDAENKDTVTKPLEDRHLDTVEKLKKRSERFKLPMPSEKDALAIKKMESEALPSVKPETPADSEIKPERPPRKRKWISN